MLKEGVRREVTVVEEREETVTRFGCIGEVGECEAVCVSIRYVLKLVLMK